MANEFGNVGVISKSIERMTAKDSEVAGSPTGAEWEVFYNGTWRDISSDYSWDITKAGNTILRAIRWDDGFRSYREDRDLILRRKEKPDEDEDTPDSDVVKSFGESFAKSFAISTGVSIGVQAFEKLLKPKLTGTSTFSSTLGKFPKIGSFLNTNKVGLFFIGLNLTTGKQPMEEKLIQSAITLSTSLILSRLGVAGKILSPLVGIAEQQILFGSSTSEAAGDVFGNIGGHIAGRYAGKAVGKTFGSFLFPKNKNVIQSMDEYMKKHATPPKSTSYDEEHALVVSRQKRAYRKTQTVQQKYSKMAEKAFNQVKYPLSDLAKKASNQFKSAKNKKGRVF